MSKPQHFISLEKFLTFLKIFVIIKKSKDNKVKMRGIKLNREMHKENLAIVGYALYVKGMTKEELDNLRGIDYLMLIDDFNAYIKAEERRAYYE